MARARALASWHFLGLLSACFEREKGNDDHSCTRPRRLTGQIFRDRTLLTLPTIILLLAYASHPPVNLPLPIASLKNTHRRVASCLCTFKHVSFKFPALSGQNMAEFRFRFKIEGKAKCIREAILALSRQGPLGFGRSLAGTSMRRPSNTGPESYRDSAYHK